MCVQQTALDLLDRGFDVHVLADGASSRSQVDRLFALEVRVRVQFVTLLASEYHVIEIDYIAESIKHTKTAY